MLLGSGGKHFEMNIGTLVSRKTNEANLAGFLCCENSFESSTWSKDAIWISVPNDFVKLKQVDAVGLEPAERFVELATRGGFVSPIDLGHQEGFFAVTIAKRFAHANFTLAAVVVPAVVQEIDALIEGLANDGDALVGVGLLAQVIAANANQRDSFAGAAKLAIRDAILGFGSRVGRRNGCMECSGHHPGRSKFQELTTAQPIPARRSVYLRKARTSFLVCVLVVFHGTLFCPLRRTS